MTAMNVFTSCPMPHAAYFSHLSRYAAASVSGGIQESAPADVDERHPERPVTQERIVRHVVDGVHDDAVQSAPEEA